MFNHTKSDRRFTHNRRKRHIRTSRSGQGLVEYALILALVALVAIAATFLIGLAAQRVYGVIAAATGAKYNSTGSSSIVIENAVCHVVHAQSQTGLDVYGLTNIDVSLLTASTEMAVGTGMDGAAFPVQQNGSAGTFKFNPLLATTADAKYCPQAIVVQSNKGAIAVSPVTIKVWN